MVNAAPISCDLIKPESLGGTVLSSYLGEHKHPTSTSIKNMKVLENIKKSTLTTQLNTKIYTMVQVLLLCFIVSGFLPLLEKLLHLKNAFEHLFFLVLIFIQIVKDFELWLIAK